MQQPAISRRGFLAAGAGLVVAAACGGSDDDTAAPTTLPGPSVAGAVATSDLFVGDLQRFAFGVLRTNAAGEMEPVLGEPVKAGVAPEGARPTRLFDAEFHGTGLERGVYVVSASFDRPGVWNATIEVGGKRGTVPFEVSAEPKVPAPGSAAISAPSPTTADPLGVDPICTRQTPCPFHEVSLDTALAGSTPVALMFSTPARCVSRMCGPVLDMMIEESAALADRVTFVHVEIYKNLESQDTVPTVGAWGLPSEPWLFGIASDGTITARLDGAFDEGEIRALLSGLVD